MEMVHKSQEAVQLRNPRKSGSGNPCGRSDLPSCNGSALPWPAPSISGQQKSTWDVKCKVSYQCSSVSSSWHTTCIFMFPVSWCFACTCFVQWFHHVCTYLRALVNRQWRQGSDKGLMSLCWVRLKDLFVSLSSSFHSCGPSVPPVPPVSFSSFLKLPGWLFSAPTSLPFSILLLPCSGQGDQPLRTLAPGLPHL